MLLNTKALTGIPVVTRAGARLGKMTSFDVDDVTGKIAIMRVKASGIMARLTEDELLVPWNAIVEMTVTRIMVTDASLPAQAHLAVAQLSPKPSTTLMREG